ncbi:hypothetical protein [Nitrosopumilus spindle-shaped virus]|uniref:Uncharacterized protein n=1 Tax=Nitrosopumilus spindle-shaped virus TaxID=2508184 RepID=A0A514K397_9VIRU|nr:hypothetical protein [Nitrosopumilus spindle-shaped virus]
MIPYEHNILYLFMAVGSLGLIFLSFLKIDDERFFVIVAVVSLSLFALSMFLIVDHYNQWYESNLDFIETIECPDFEKNYNEINSGDSSLKEKVKMKFIFKCVDKDKKFWGFDDV